MNSIKSKIVVFAVIATLLPAAGLGLLSFKQNETLISDSVTRELRTLSDSISRQMDLWLDENTLAVRALSTSNPVIEGLSVLNRSPNDSDSEETKQARSAMAGYLHSVQGKLDQILELTVFDNARQIVASSTVISEAYVIPERWPHNSLITGAITTPPGWNTRYATATFSIVFPVLSYDSQLIGTIAATLDFGSLKSKLVEARAFSSGEVIILDRNGKVLLSSAPGVSHPAKLESYYWELIQMLDESMTYAGLAYPKAIGLAHTLETLPVTVLVERNYHDIHLTWVKLRNRFLAFVGILVIIVTAVALYMGHSIVTPLEKLINAVKEIVNGNFDTRLPVTQKDEIGQLTSMFNQMTDVLRRKHREIMAANQAMQQQNQLLQKLSVTDGLTKLYNRGKLNDILTEQLARFKRHHRAFCLLMIDVDHFKNINDDLGHIMGDKILVTVAAVLLKSIRTIDYAARYGGDEFMIILTETNAGAAVKTAERIRTQVSAACREFTEHPIKITLSIGITQSQHGDTVPADLIARADAALYEAKKAGRNQVHCIGTVIH